MDSQVLFDLIRRDAVEIYNEEQFLEQLKSGRSLTIKFGADPSRPDLHLGHSVPLRKLRMLQDAGHRIVFIIGDFTAMIGDPSGKNKTRPPLSFEETRENARSYLEQVNKILDPEKTSITYNSEWLGKMSFQDILTLAGKTTLARILERDDFAKRYTGNQAIGLHELLYPLMQGYDSVSIRADIEVGGTDQTFNLLMGRNLQKDYGQDPQVVLTFPLLPGLDGVEKMSKSLDNYIGIDEAPEIMYEKCMRVPDSLLLDYFRLTTDIDMNEAKKAAEADSRAAHFMYADIIVEMYHGKEAAQNGRRRYDSVAAGGVPENMPESQINIGDGMPLVEILTGVGFLPSKSEARRNIEQGGILLNGVRVSEPGRVITREDAPEGFIVIKKGKKSFIKVII